MNAERMQKEKKQQRTAVLKKRNDKQNRSIRRRRSKIVRPSANDHLSPIWMELKGKAKRWNSKEGNNKPMRRQD